MNLARPIAVTVLPLLLAACSGTEADTKSSTASRATPTADFPYSVEPEPIEAGTYEVPRSEWSVVDYTVTFPEGWTSQYSHTFAANADQDSEYGFYAVLVDEIYDDPCTGPGNPVAVERGTEALVAALRKQPGTRTSGPEQVTFGGRPAVRVDFRVPRGLDLGTCRLADDGVDGLQIWHSAPADKYFVLLPDSVYTAHILDIDGWHQVFLSSYRTATPQKDRDELQQVLDSIRIEP